jgi:hypothetical protein
MKRKKRKENFRVNRFMIKMKKFRIDKSNAKNVVFFFLPVTFIFAGSFFCYYLATIFKILSK